MPRPELVEASPPTPQKDPYKFDQLLLDSVEDLGIFSQLRKGLLDPLGILRFEVLKSDIGKTIQITSYGDTSTLRSLLEGEHAEEKKSYRRIDFDNPELQALLPRFFITALAIKLRRSEKKFKDEFTNWEEETYRMYRRQGIEGIRSNEIRDLIKPLLQRFT